jgi:hypothetical protein
MRTGRFLGDDELFLKGLYARSMGKPLNLRHPKTFGEKLQWLKLHDRNPKYKSLVDKFEVKKLVGSLIGEEYIIPTLGIYESFEDIDFSLLPAQFVLKTTNGGGSTGVVICRDIFSFNIIEAKKKLTQSMSLDVYRTMGEWAYKGIQPRIIAETLMSDGENIDLPDYKFFCFHGTPVFCQVIKNRSKKETIDFYDVNWEHQPFIGLNPKAVHSTEKQQCPSNYKHMLEIARSLSANIPFARVDLYDIKGRIYFGEITFYPNSGFGSFSPDIWNYTLGEMIKI